MFIKEGSTTDYFHTAGNPMQFGYPKFKNLYAWGWLEASAPTIGWEDEKLKKKVVKKLKKIPQKQRVDHFMGYHTCKVCSGLGKKTMNVYKDGGSFCGSIKIAHNDKVYCCPSGVEHYIEAHDYRPANEVVDAILTGHYYTDEEIKEIGKKDPDVIKAIAAMEKRKTKWKKEEEKEYNKKVKRVQSKSFKKKLKKAMLQRMGF